LRKRGLDRPEALVEREPRRPSVPGQHCALLSRRVKAVAESGVPVHQVRSLTCGTDNTDLLLRCRAQQLHRPCRKPAVLPSRRLVL